MSELTQMLNHQAKLHSRQNASSLAILLGNAADKIDQQEALLKEKQLEIDEVDLRCAELENTIQAAEAGLIHINAYLKISTLDEIATDLNNAIDKSSNV